jgi:chaperonin cofactor prefoldin
MTKSAQFGLNYPENSTIMSIRPNAEELALEDLANRFQNCEGPRRGEVLDLKANLATFKALNAQLENRLSHLQNETDGHVQKLSTANARINSLQHDLSIYRQGGSSQTLDDQSNAPAAVNGRIEELEITISILEKDFKISQKRKGVLEKELEKWRTYDDGFNGTKEPAGSEDTNVQTNPSQPEPTSRQQLDAANTQIRYLQNEIIMLKTQHKTQLAAGEKEKDGLWRTADKWEIIYNELLEEKATAWEILSNDKQDQCESSAEESTTSTAPTKNHIKFLEKENSDLKKQLEDSENLNYILRKDLTDCIAFCKDLQAKENVVYQRKSHQNSSPTESAKSETNTPENHSSQPTARSSDSEMNSCPQRMTLAEWIAKCKDTRANGATESPSTENPLVDRAEPNNKGPSSEGAESDEYGPDEPGTDAHDFSNPELYQSESAKETVTESDETHTPRSWLDSSWSQYKPQNEEPSCKIDLERARQAIKALKEILAEERDAHVAWRLEYERLRQAAEVLKETLAPG